MDPMNPPLIEPTFCPDCGTSVLDYGHFLVDVQPEYGHGHWPTYVDSGVEHECRGDYGCGD